MNDILTRIRPDGAHLTDAQSSAMLRTVLADGERRPSRRRRRLILVGLGGTLAVGGAAWAGGLVPGVVADRFHQMTASEDSWPYPIKNERVIADVTLSSGDRARVWIADTTDGRCEIRDVGPTPNRPEDLAVGCGIWGPGEEHSYRRGVVWQFSPEGPGLAYGEFGGTTMQVAQVRVSGDGWQRTFAVDKLAFAGEVPHSPDGTHLRFTYLSADGGVLGTRGYEVETETE